MEIYQLLDGKKSLGENEIRFSKYFLFGKGVSKAKVQIIMDLGKQPIARFAVDKSSYDTFDKVHPGQKMFAAILDVSPVPGSLQTVRKYLSLYEVHELELKDGFEERRHETNLPHSAEIVSTFCKQWNKDADEFMLSLINEECDNRIASCYMRQYDKESGKTVLAVEFVVKEGKNLTGRIKEAIRGFMKTQWCHGWGISMFGTYAGNDGVEFGVDELL